MDPCPIKLELWGIKARYVICNWVKELWESVIKWWRKKMCSGNFCLPEVWTLRDFYLENLWIFCSESLFHRCCGPDWRIEMVSSKIDDEFVKWDMWICDTCLPAWEGAPSWKSWDLDRSLRNRLLEMLPDDRGKWRYGQFNKWLWFANIGYENKKVLILSARMLAQDWAPEPVGIRRSYFGAIN